MTFFSCVVSSVCFFALPSVVCTCFLFSLCSRSSWYCSPWRRRRSRVSFALSSHMHWTVFFLLSSSSPTRCWWWLLATVVVVVAWMGSFACSLLPHLLAWLGRRRRCFLRSLHLDVGESVRSNVLFFYFNVFVGWVGEEKGCVVVRLDSTVLLFLTALLEYRWFKKVIVDWTTDKKVLEIFFWSLMKVFCAIATKNKSKIADSWRFQLGFLRIFSYLFIF